MADESKEPQTVQGPPVYPEVPLVFQGDEALTKIKYNRLYSKEQIEYWFEELKKAHPGVPEGLLLQTLDLFSTHPHVLEQVVSEHQANPNAFLHHINQELKYDLEC
tara:strand:- start:2860 stop:3177 length:318 start_codon:yes stop_codon:yes gene_type:complete